MRPTLRQKVHLPEETGVFHVICILVILFLRTNSHPEEVLWLLPFINDLGDTYTHYFDIIHFIKKDTKLTKAKSVF